ncbi:murein biosynthesis integral membrane protein MurJ [Dactylosporangium sp. CS-047395]|uniref:murein biosynthesis integral membrane protein MurJ n=1 Tax=Dactylosporangium sp. CS-047395 TaxID=3239936 RepID=UPI003D93B832
MPAGPPPVDPGQTVRLHVGQRPPGMVDPANAPTVALPFITPRPQVVADAPVVEESAPPSAADDDSTGTVVRNSSTMAILSLVSRATGFVRAAAIAAAIGGAVVGDDYTLANNLPNQVYELLLGGVLASVLIPTLVRARKDEPDRGEAHAQRLLTLAAVALGIATLIVVVAAPLITAIYTLGNDKVTTSDRDLITLLAYLLLPEIFFYGLAGISAAILNVRGHFAAPMWTPILNNIVVIATAGLFMLVRGGGVPTPETITLPQVLILGIGTTLGIVVQAAGLWPAMRKTGFKWKWRFDFRKLHLRELAKLGAWMLLYVGVNQVGITVVMALAKQTQLHGGEGPAVFNNAFLIFMMAHGIVAVSVITAIMPRISAAAADGRFTDVTEQLAQASRLAAVVLIPASAVYLVLGRPLAVTLFNWGHYDYDQSLATGSVVAAAGLGLVPFALSQMQTSVFYAMRDTKTPALVNIGGVAVRLILDVSFYFILPVAVVTTSLMVGTALSYLVALIVGYVLLRQRLGRLGLRRLLDTLIRLTAAAAAGGLLALGLSWLIAQILDPGKLLGVVQLILGTGVLLGVYAAGGIFLKVPEVSQFAGMIRRRLGR